MIETFSLLAEFIRTDILIAFGWYSLFLFFGKRFATSKAFFIEFDRSAVSVVIYAGILYVFLRILEIGASLYLIEGGDRIAFLQRTLGNYIWLLLLQFISCLLITQLLRFRGFRNNLFYRLFLALFFAISYEMFVILATSYQADYLPSFWMPAYHPGMLLLGIFTKLLVFIVIVALFHFGKKRFNKRSFPPHSTPS